MIVPMCKTYITSRYRDRRRLVEAVGRLGVVHLAPVDPSRAMPDEHTLDRIRSLERALQVLESTRPDDAAPDTTVGEAAREVLDILRRRAAKEHRLSELHHQLQQIRIWGDLELAGLQQLSDAGIEVDFYSIPQHQVDEIEAACVEVVGRLPGHRALAAVVSRADTKLPPTAKRLPLPPRDSPSIRGEAAEIDASLKADRRRLGRLAHLAGSMRAELARLQREAAETIALRGAVANEALFAIQGWIPDERAPSLADDLARAGISAAVRVTEAAGNEEPPTWVRPPAWTRPIEGLFGVMGTVPGYREFDVSIPFLIALPIFTAMLISDGGYGLVILLALAVWYRQATSALGTAFTQLLILVGLVALLWGAVCATFFGVTLYPPLIPVDMSEHSRLLMMKICFAMGALHLSVAQVWQAVRLFPNLRFLSRLGWTVFIWGMFGVVQMFVLRVPVGWNTPWPYLLITGSVLAVCFHRPSWNVVKTLVWGIAACPLSMMSAFSDVISYVRLMAVGMASSVLAVSFNELARGTDVWPLALLILILGHSLNMGLAMIAMFAHGVRLNMLEFSNNLGMQWTGYPYNPYSNEPRGSDRYGNGVHES